MKCLEYTLLFFSFSPGGLKSAGLYSPGNIVGGVRNRATPVGGGTPLTPLFNPATPTASPPPAYLDGTVPSPSPESAPMVSMTMDHGPNITKGPQPIDDDLELFDFSQF